MIDEEFSGIQKKLFLWLFVAVLGGNAGVIALNKANPESRADPFTGTEGKELERRIDRIDAEQQKMIWRMVNQETAATECRKTLQDHLRERQ